MNEWKAIKVFDVQSSNSVCGLTADNNGNLYFTTSSASVYFIRNSSRPNLLFSVYGSEFRGIHFFQDTLYVCDYRQHKIVMYSMHAGTISTLELPYHDQRWKIEKPQTITVHNNGDKYVTTKNSVLIINPLKSPEVIGTTQEGHADGPAIEAKFNNPICHVIGPDNTIYVADWANHCIRQIKDKVVSTLAGIPQQPGIDDGPLRRAQFRYPQALIIGPDGNLLVGDDTGLRLVNLSRKVVTTILTIWPPIRSLCVVVGVIYAGSRALCTIHHTWNWERFLWIAHLKENSQTCLLATLPKEIVQEIASLLRI